jgi:hypothetical protein
MKSRYWVYTSIFVLIMLALILWRRLVPQETGSELKQLTAKLASESTNLEAKRPSASNQIAIAPRLQGSSDAPQNNPQNRLGMLQKALEEKNAPIYFFGRVVDQDSNSLAGVEIKFYIRHWELTADAESRPIRLEKTTDSNGCFEVSGVTGDGCSIEYLDKDKYELEPTQRSFGVSSGTFENPIVFKMWGTNIHEQLITGQKTFQIEPDGRPYVIDLAKATIAESGDGDLKVTIKYPTQVIHGQTYDWSCEIDVINGGLLEEDNLNSSMYSAPTDGYIPAFHLAQQIKGGQSGSIGTKRFYVKLKNGQEYGRITIELYAPYNNQIPGMVRLQYAINPSGSDILR